MRTLVARLFSHLLHDSIGSSVLAICTFQLAQQLLVAQNRLLLVFREVMTLLLPFLCLARGSRVKLLDVFPMLAHGVQLRVQRAVLVLKRCVI